jgi:hypothetical protein
MFSTARTNICLPIPRARDGSPQKGRLHAEFFGTPGKSGTGFCVRSRSRILKERMILSPNRSRLANHAPTISGEISMIITTAHIPAIVALIAGILILIMPRLLNLVVAIYLICTGLIGLGLLKWLHM